ncbi:MAG: IclR family transcriptional regulator [Pseudonocardiales bacterium]
MTASAPVPLLPAPGTRTEQGVLERGLAALQFVAERGEVTATGLVQGLQLGRSSAYRLLDRLRSSGYLQESSVPGVFRLGPRVLPIGLAALNQLDIMDIAPAHLMALAKAAGETVNLAVPLNDEMIYVYQAEGPGGVKVTAHLGTRRPLNCSSLGKAYLAALSREELDERLPQLTAVALTVNSVVDIAALRTELDATRARRYSIDAEEVEAGVSCVGAAIRDSTGRPVAAISVAGPAERMPGKHETVVPLVLEAAEQISRRMGCRT